jgi:hypothetical protein
MCESERTRESELVFKRQTSAPTKLSHSRQSLFTHINAHTHTHTHTLSTHLHIHNTHSLTHTVSAKLSLSFSPIFSYGCRMTGKGGNRREGYFVVVVAACVPPASARACKILPKVKTLKRKIFFFFLFKRNLTKKKKTIYLRDTEAQCSPPGQ